jgi:hypothetical protein
VTTGKWSDTDDVGGLNQAAAALGPSLNIFSTGGPPVATAPAFVAFDPTTFLRPFTALSDGGDN